MKNLLYIQNKAISVLLALLFMAFGNLLSAQVQAVFSPDGYAGAQGTTGGGNATPITVNSTAEFKNAVGGSNAAVIIVNGMFDLGGNVNIGSNKTIVGASTNSGLYNGTIKIGGTNVILQNLTMGPAGGDVLEVSGATKVYITRCTFHDSTDELCSVVRQADYVTISWCRFYFDNPDSHSFVHLIGNGDGVTADEGKLHVTLHHNWYDYGIRGRIPRVRFGKVHIYNNYFNATETGYAIGTGYKCNVRVESCHFEDTRNLWKDHGGISNGQIGWNNLKVEGGSIPSFMPNTFPAFSLPYSFSLDPVDDVKDKVKACAGNVVCDLKDCNGVLNGQAYTDECGECVGGNTGKQACYLDCNGVEDGTALIDECGICSGGNTGIEACTGVMQGENACSYDGTIDSDNQGFQGEGFLNLTNSTGSSATWILNSASAKTSTIAVRYANGGDAARPMSIAVNGNNQGSFLANPSGGWTTWITENLTLNLSEGVNTIVLTATTESGGPNIDLFSLEEDVLVGSCEEDCDGVIGGIASIDLCGTCSGGTTGIEANSSCEQEPFTGTPHPIPGRIEAEDFDEGVNGLAFYETDEENKGGADYRTGGVDLEVCADQGGGYNLAWTAAGEWLEYTVDVAASGSYDIGLRVASDGAGKTINLSMDGTTIASAIEIPNTEAWGTYQTVTIPDVTLSAGEQVLRLTIGESNYVNINWLEFKSLITSVSMKSDLGISVFPNPVKEGWFTIDAEQAITYQIRDASGIVHLSGGTSFKVTIGQNLPSGIYFAEIKNGQGIEVFKIIKQ